MVRIKLTPEMTELFKKLHNYYGTDHQCMVACEECGELIQAISKMRRSSGSRIAREHLLDETADVYIMLAQIMYLFGISEDELSFYIEAKLNRQKERMRKLEEGNNDPQLSLGL